MSRDLHVQFLLDQPPSDDHHEPSSFDSPPPWEPHFEVIQSSPARPSRRPLDPPPPCFSTLSPRRIRSHNFPSFRIPAVNDKLTDGFRLLHPHNLIESHGIGRSDWIRFLEDLGIAARLSHEGLSAVGSRVPFTPSIIHRIFPPRTLGAVYDRCFARSPVEEVRALIDIWNQCAFERRKIRVLLQVRPSRRRGKNSYMLIVESL